MSSRQSILTQYALVEDGNYFAVLNLPASATPHDIRAAYVSLRRRFEPSLALSADTADLKDKLDEIATVLTEAYDVLRDHDSRERYRRAIGE